LRVLVRDGLVQNAARLGKALSQRFRQAQVDLPIIGDVRGLGLMLGLELVKPDGSPAPEVVKAVIDGAAAAGLVITKCGVSTLRIAPPLILSAEQADEAATILLDLLREVPV
jgi:4-aminobutyrate aminotransferase